MVSWTDLSSGHVLICYEISIKLGDIAWIGSNHGVELGQMIRKMWSYRNQDGLWRDSSMLSLVILLVPTNIISYNVDDYLRPLSSIYWRNWTETCSRIHIWAWGQWRHSTRIFLWSILFVISIRINSWKRLFLKLALKDSANRIAVTWKNH